MSRGQGRLYRPIDGRGNESAVWWMDYTVAGQRHRESSETAVKSEAQDVLRQRVGDRISGKVVGRPEKVFLAVYQNDPIGQPKLTGGLRWLHETQYDLDGLRSKERIVQCWNRIEQFFKAPTPVTAVTPTRLDAYAEWRLADGAARQTVNNELSALRRGLNLAIEKGLLSHAPVIKLPKVQNAREGFFEDSDFAAVLVELPGYAQAPIRFSRVTGWRIEEVLQLTWDRIEWAQEAIRLSEQQTKGKKKRLFPFGLAPDLKAVLQAAWAARNGPFVFQGPRAGHRVGYTTLLHHWQKATKRADCAGRIIHDLRRTAVRDFVDAGVDRNTIKALCGIKTDSIFDRYDIVDQGRMAEAVARRYGKATARQAPVSPA